MPAANGLASDPASRGPSRRVGGSRAPADVAEAEAIQRRLRTQVDLTGRLGAVPRWAVGLDVSYEVGTNRICAAAVAIDLDTLAVAETSIAFGQATFPYVPGLLAFREVPILLEALDRLNSEPELLICDGYGIAHPRRFGLACHLGVVAGLPSFGVAKTPFTTGFANPGPDRGSWSALVEDGEVLGCAVRTRDGVKPVFVSVGHRIGLAQARDITLRLSPRYRIPEATRQADIASRRALRAAPGA